MRGRCGNKYFMGLLTLAAFFFILKPVVVIAIPPDTIDLEYNKETKTLHIDLAHISKDPREHFIRKLVVFQNDKEVKVYRFNRQTSPQGLTQDVTFEALSGDVIRVLAVCNEAGRKEEEIKIP